MASNEILSSTSTPATCNKGKEEHAIEVTEEAVSERSEAHLYSFWGACALNTMMMFGTGPYISIPFTLAATNPPGPQALVGYGIAAVGCIADSLVWGELGSRFPSSGGTYTNLRQCFGYNSWGQLAAFIYFWQFWVSCPAEIASGFIAITGYLQYFTGPLSYAASTATAVGFTVFSFGLLTRRAETNDKIVILLWAITLASMAFVLIGGLANLNPDYFALPPNPFGDPATTPLSTFVFSLGAACRFGIYDFTGYYDVCRMGAEVKNPRRTIPYSCIMTCIIVAVIYMLTYVAVIGYLPWYGEDGFVAMVLNEGEDGSANYIMGMFAEKMVNEQFATFFVVVVVIVIFSSLYSNIVGSIYLPGVAAEEGYFLKQFAYRPASGWAEGVPLLSLALLGTLSCVWCFFSLDTVVDALTTMLVMVQFLGQGIGLCVLRYRIWAGHVADDPLAWKIPCFPLFAALQISIFGFILITTDNYLISGGDPLLDLAVLFLIVGGFCFLLRQRARKEWPFQVVEPVKLKQIPIEITKEELAPTSKK